MPVRSMDEKNEPGRSAGEEERETLHQYVGGVISNPKSTKKMGQEKVKGTTPEESRTDTSEKSSSRSDSSGDVRSDSNTGRSRTGGSETTSSRTR